MTVIGKVTKREFDRGVVLSLGAQSFSYVVDGVSRSSYVLNVPGMRPNLPNFGNLIPVTIVFPDEVYQPKLIPCVIVRPSDDFELAFGRVPWFGWVGRKPAVTSSMKTLADGRVGYTAYENQWRALPLDFPYDVQYYARDREDSTLLMMHLLGKFRPPLWGIKVVDSLTNVREYDAVELRMSGASELADIDDRKISMNFSFTVRGELDVEDAVEMPAFIGASQLPETDPLYSRHDVVLGTRQI